MMNHQQQKPILFPNNKNVIENINIKLLISDVNIPPFCSCVYLHHLMD